MNFELEWIGGSSNELRRVYGLRHQPSRSFLKRAANPRSATNAATVSQRAHVLDGKSELYFTASPRFRTFESPKAKATASLNFLLYMKINLHIIINRTVIKANKIM